MPDNPFEEQRTVVFQRGQMPPASPRPNEGDGAPTRSTAPSPAAAQTGHSGHDQTQGGVMPPAPPGPPGGIIGPDPSPFPMMTTKELLLSYQRRVPAWLIVSVAVAAFAAIAVGVMM